MAVKQPGSSRGKGRPFQKGQSGNPHGRPKLGNSLAERIRLAGEANGWDEETIAQMWTLAAKPHSDAHARIKAAEWIAKHGWPDEAKGTTTIKTDAQGNTTVTHVHQP